MKMVMWMEWDFLEKVKEMDEEEIEEDLKESLTPSERFFIKFYPPAMSAIFFVICLPFFGLIPTLVYTVSLFLVSSVMRLIVKFLKIGHIWKFLLLVGAIFVVMSIVSGSLSIGLTLTLLAIFSLAIVVIVDIVILTRKVIKLVKEKNGGFDGEP